MVSDSKVLLKKISSISQETKKFIEKEKLWNGKYLLILNKNYPYLPPQYKTHEKIKIPEGISNKIVSLMKSDKKIKDFLSINLQFFLSLFENDSKFIRYFEKEIERNPELDVNKCKRMIKEIQKICFEEYDDENYSITLKILLFFGFMHPKFNKEKLDLDEPKIFFMKFLEAYFYRNLWKFRTDEEPKLSFVSNILNPFIKLCKVIGISNLIITDNYRFVYLDEGKINQKIIQDFFCCFQYHYFFEVYVNNFFRGKGKVLENPLIIFNPSERTDREGNIILEGYFELDGSLCIIKDKKLILIECKNTDWVYIDHLTHFIGKTRLIEKICGIDIEKLLFSTGSRFYIWENFEDYPSCSDIKIYCRKSFVKGFSDLEI